MRFIGALVRFYTTQLIRMTGIPWRSHYSVKRMIFTFSLTAVIVTLYFVLPPRIPEPVKVYLPDILFAHWSGILLMAVSIGSLFGTGWIKTEDPESDFLLSLPLSRRFVACYNIVWLLLCIVGLILLGVLLTVPWGAEVGWGVYTLKWFFVSSVFLTGMTGGLLLFSLIARSIAYHRWRTIGSFVVSVVFFTLAYFVFTRPEPVLHFIENGNVISWAIAVLCSVVVLLVLVRLTSLYLPVLFETEIDRSDERAVRSKGEKRWGSFIVAIAKKDYIQYSREMSRFLKTLFIPIVLIIMSRYGIFGDEYTVRLMLFAIPYYYAGILTLHLIRIDGIALSIIKMLNGTLKSYYLIRILLSYIYVGVPAFVSYCVLALIFSRESLYSGYLILLLFLNLVAVLQSTGISLLFRQKDYGNVQPKKRGVSFLGEMLYWLTALWLPVVLTRWEPGGPIFGELPVTLSLIIAVTTLTATLAISVISVLHIDRIDWQ